MPEVRPWGGHRAQAASTPPFCEPDFVEFFRNQVREAIRKHRMFTPEEGRAGGGVGRQGLAGACGSADRGGLPDDRPLPRPRHLRLFIESKARCEKFATAHGVPLIVTASPKRSARRADHQTVTRRPPCFRHAGLSKRYLMNRVALERGFPWWPPVTNLDDEAATPVRVGHALADRRAPAQSPGAGGTHPKWCVA